MSKSYGLVLLVAAPWFVVAAYGQATDAAAAPSSLPVPALSASSPQAQIEQLRNELAELRRQMAQPATAQPRAPNLRTDPQARLAAERTERTRIAAAEDAFRSEPNNPAFIERAAIDVRDAFASAADSVRDRIRSVECRSRSCRVEIGGAGTIPADADLIPVLSRLAPTLPMAVVGHVDQGASRGTTVLYLSRWEQSN